MKKIYIPLIAILCGICLTGCTVDAVDSAAQTDGYGTFALSLTAEDIRTDVTTTRNGTEDGSATGDGTATGGNTTEGGNNTDGTVNNPNIPAATPDDFHVYLTDNQGNAIINGKTVGTLDDKDRTLPTGEGYHIAVESCTAAEALTENQGWGCIRFAAEQTFEIAAGEETALELTCTMANAGLHIIFDEKFQAKFTTTYAATTQNDGRSLIFNSENPEAIAYYNVTGETAPTVTLRLAGASGNGWESERLDMLKDIPLTTGKITVLTISYSQETGDLELDFTTNKNDMTDENIEVPIK